MFSINKLLHGWLVCTIFIMHLLWKIWRAELNEWDANFTIARIKEHCNYTNLDASKKGQCNYKKVTANIKKSMQKFK